MTRNERDGRVSRLVGGTALALAAALAVMVAGGMDRGRVVGPTAGTGTALAQRVQVWAPGQRRTSQAVSRRSALPVRVQVWAPGQPLTTGRVVDEAPPGQPRG